MPQVHLARDMVNRSHELVLRKDALKALQPLGHAVTKVEKIRSISTETAANHDGRRDAEAKQRAANALRGKVVTAAMAKLRDAAAARKPDADLFRLLVRGLLRGSWHDTVADTVRRRGALHQRPVDERQTKAGPEQVGHLPVGHAEAVLQLAGQPKCPRPQRNGSSAASIRGLTGIGAADYLAASAASPLLGDDAHDVRPHLGDVDDELLEILDVVELPAAAAGAALERRAESFIDVVRPLAKRTRVPSRPTRLAALLRGLGLRASESARLTTRQAQESER